MPVQGRNALACLIHAKHIRKLYIPNYLCDSVFRVCEREECPYEFYEVGADFLPKFEKALGNGEWIYIVNYFGQILNERELKKKYDRILSHEFFQPQVTPYIHICSTSLFPPTAVFSLSLPTVQDNFTDTIHILNCKIRINQHICSFPWEI